MTGTSEDTQPSGATPEDDARPACTWDICRSPRTGKCFAWCKCICHEWAAARARDTRRQRAETTTATVEDAVLVIHQALQGRWVSVLRALQEDADYPAMLHHVVQKLADAGLLRQP